MSARSDRRWRLALAALLLGGGAVVAWLAVRPLRSEPPGLSWSLLAPARDAAPRGWRWIVVHHSGTAEGDAASIDLAHERGRGWDGIGYHFVIGNGAPMPRGRIEATFRWRDQRAGAHAGAGDAQRPYNQAGIGICVIGDYRDRGLDPLVESRLVELCALLVRQHPTLSAERVIGHREVPGKATACPGSIDLPRLRRLVAARLERP